MKRATLMLAHQLEPFARFLEERPGFSPLLVGEDAVVCGFQVGSAYLRGDEMEKLVATQHHFDKRQTAVLLNVLTWTRSGKR